MITKQRTKNFLIILFVFSIILISFLIPNLLFKVEDLNMEKQIYSRSKHKNKIDVQAEKIYLVSAINDISNSNYKRFIANDIETSNYKTDVKNERESVTQSDSTDIPNYISYTTTNEIESFKNEFSKMYKCQ